jgi:diacylglycerol kinase (ATP)
MTELARDAVAGGADLVVVVGGDGSINEAANGLVGSSAELAVLPNGTGQDFIRSHGIPSGFEAAVDVVLHGVARDIDAGRVTYRTWAGAEAQRHFANVASAGMSGAVAQRANQMSKVLGGRTTFFYALVRVFFTWENTELTVELDSETRTGRMHDVVVANGRWHGGAMLLAPDARPDDGLFDVLLIGDVTKADFVRTVPKIYRGTHLSHPKVEVIRSSRARVDAPEPLPIELDGEQVGTTPVLFEIVPRALRVRAPAP